MEAKSIENERLFGRDGGFKGYYGGADFESWVDGVENGNHSLCHSRMYREQVPSKARHDERAEVDGGFATVAIFDSSMHSACANSFKHVVASR